MSNIAGDARFHSRLHVLKTGNWKLLKRGEKARFNTIHHISQIITSALS